MNRLERLTAALDGTGMEHRAGDLAQLPAATVDLIVAAIKASRRAAIAADKERRRRRKHDDRVHGNYDDADLADRDDRLAKKHADRAGRNLDTLTRLKQHYDDGPAVLALAVAGARAQGYSDAAIGRALGVTRWAVGSRFGRCGRLTTERPGAAGTGGAA